MSRAGGPPRARFNRPDIGPSLPTATVPLLYLAVAVGLCLLVLKSPWMLSVGLSLAVLGTLVPNHLPPWWILPVLGQAQLWRAPSATDVVYYLLLAGLHLLYVLGGLALLMPWNGRIQVGTLARVLRRWLVVQAVVQPVAAGALHAFSGGPGRVTGLSIVAAGILCLVAVALGPGHVVSGRGGDVGPDS